MTSSFISSGSILSGAFISDGDDYVILDGGVELPEDSSLMFWAVDDASNAVSSKMIVRSVVTLAPVITLTGDTTTSLQSSTLSASADQDVTIYYSADNENWTAYTGSIPITSNGTWYFKATNTDDMTGYAQMTFENIDTMPPLAPTASANVTTSTTQLVTLEMLPAASIPRNQTVPLSLNSMPVV